MATEQSVTRVTLPSAADLSTKQYLFGYIDANGKIAVVASQGALSAGIISNAPAAADRECSLDILGVTKCKAGDTITAGNRLTPGADGRAEVAANGDYVAAYAIESGVDGEVIPILLISQYLAVI